MSELQRLSGWGRQPWQNTNLFASEALEAASSTARLSRGLGRAYGDAALPASEDDLVLSTVRADRLLSFDQGNGVLRAESGLALGKLYEILLPRGFFTPVAPGTRHVTLGGMFASTFTARITTSRAPLGGTCVPYAFASATVAY